MKRRTKEPTQAELMAAVEKPPAPTWRERQAMRRLWQSDMQIRRDGAGWDPLELRLGARVWAIQHRPGFAVSSPMHHTMLLRRPDMDNSLPGTAWLNMVYRRPARLTQLVLPGVLARLRAKWEQQDAARLARLQPKQEPKPQAELFA